SASASPHTRSQDSARSRRRRIKSRRARRSTGEIAWGAPGGSSRVPARASIWASSPSRGGGGLASLVWVGKGKMPPWRGTLGQAELDQLWAYIRAHAD